MATKLSKSSRYMGPPNRFASTMTNDFELSYRSYDKLVAWPKVSCADTQVHSPRSFVETGDGMSVEIRFILYWKTYPATERSSRTKKNDSLVTNRRIRSRELDTYNS